MLKAVIVFCLMGLVSISVGLMVWQTDFAETEMTSKYQARQPKPDHEGVPQSLTDDAPWAARVIAGVQSWFRPEQTSEPPRVNRGGRTNREGFDIRYTRRPGD